MVRTRIVCVSDTHGYTPQQGAFKLPKGDVLIHAGDLSNQGSLSELQRTVGWIENSDFEVKIVIAGLLNHTHHHAVSRTAVVGRLGYIVG